MGEQANLARLLPCPAQNSRISRGKAFKAETDKMLWNVNEEWFERWAKGETRIPIMDAGMRQLNNTGWMHNRLRMITYTIFD